MTTLPELLRERLRALGVSDDDAARVLRRRLENVGVTLTRQSVHAWFSGRSSPAGRLPDIFRALDVPPEDQVAWVRCLPRRKHAHAPRTSSAAGV